MSDSAPALHAIVRGRVQGVGFRFFVERQARAIGLTGYVRNSGDGSVEVVAEGPRLLLESLLQDLRRGPRTAQVREVVADWREASGAFADFSVRS
jgi:acylphosphatase